MIENLHQQIGKLEKKEITKCIDQLDSKAIGFLEVLDLIEILLMKSQFLEKSKVIDPKVFGFKRASSLNCQKHARVQTFRLNSIQEEIDTIHFKIELLIQKLRTFNPKVFRSH